MDHAVTELNAVVAELERVHRRLRKSATYQASEERPSRLLAAVKHYPLAQVLSYNRGEALATLAAVSPGVRVWSEIASNGRSRTNLNIPLSGDRFMHELQCNFRTAQPIENISWWLERCPLAVRARDAEALNQVIAAPPAVRDKLTSLYLGKRECGVHVPVQVIQQLEEISVCGDAALLRAVDPTQLTKLRALKLYKCAEDTYAILCKIPHLQSLFIEGLEINAPCMHDFASAAELTHLTVVTSTLEGFTGFDACASLDSVRFHYCSAVDNLSSLAAAPRLRSISGQSIGVRYLKGLAMCPQLESIDLVSCKSLRRLSPLAGAVQLKKINVQGCDVDDITGLASCLMLESVNLNDCSHLTTLAPLAGAPRLRFIFAAGTNVQDISGLAACPLLEMLNVGWCENLHSLAPLAGSPSLRQIFAGGSGIRSIEGLNTCPALEDVDFTGCYYLDSLADLAGAPKLTRIVASRSTISSVDNLATCPSLESVEVKYCKNLHTLAPLTGAPKLGLILASRKYLSQIECPPEVLSLVRENV